MDAGFVELKSEQLKAIVEFVRGREVFVSLPTGFVKSLIYGLIPALRAILPLAFLLEVYKRLSASFTNYTLFLERLLQV